jgi:hypothetical protein
MDETNEKVEKNTAKHASRRLANSAGALDTKELGDLGELAFVLAASAKGLAVSKPYGDCRRYDLIVDSGRRLLRVQVKSLYTRPQRGPYRINSSRHRRAGRLPYTMDEIDFLAAYIAPRDIWYIVPVAAILSIRTISMFPDGFTQNRPGCAEFEIYKEAWHQLDERKGRRKLGALPL